LPGARSPEQATTRRKANGRHEAGMRVIWTALRARQPTR
jgi:hypothetical protein